MNIRNLALAAALIGTASTAATLPLKPGTYVLADVDCHDPALAALFTYDGRQFSYPHAAGCHSVVESRAGHSYRVRTTCTKLGDGDRAVPTTTLATYVVRSATQVGVSRGPERSGSLYRRCAMPALRNSAPVAR